jgi:polysaccharide chain length determinant protein (PEP-CTERM system associated)
MMDERQDNEMRFGTLRDFLAVLFKHKKRILVIFFGIVAIVTVLSFVLPPTYEAKSTVLVKFGREYLYRPEVGADKGQVISLGQPSQEEILNSEIEIITSRDLIGKVVEAVGVGRLYPELSGKTYSSGVTPKDVAVTRFGKKLAVEGIKRSNVISISFRHRDPRLAAQVINLLLENFREKHLEVYSDPQSSFLEEQLADYGRKLKASENALQDFKQAHGVYALNEQRDLMLRQRVDLDTVHKETQAKIQELQEKLGSLKAQIRATMEDENAFVFTEQGKIITDAKSKLLELQLKEQELLIKYKPNSPPIRDVQKEIRMAREFLAAQEKDVASKVKTGNLVYQEAEKERIKTEADLKAQEAKLASLGLQISRVDKDLKDLDGQEKDLQNLKRDVVINERNYQNYLDKYEEARISDDMNTKKMANISVIQAAVVPAEPISPKKALNIGLSVLLGAACALGAVFLSEYLGHTFNTAQDVERVLGLRVLASVTGSSK